MFLKYEEVMNDSELYVKKLAESIGYPFSFEEEQGGLVKKLIDLCSFENLSNLDVNKTGNDMKTTMRQRTRRSSEKARLEIGKTILHPRWLIGSTI
uniref:Sulfotransferase n=1 Tax=Gossypium raimondii TaxID=29730 RepID=A0A0D2MFS3_GOSRA|nr:hypothetical protein B456_002G250000 [Gossypium raimondii]